MLFFDQLKKNDPQLRLVAVMLTAGFVILLVGLWWVEVVSGQTYQSHLETQSYRTIRIPAVRGKILDNTGQNVLAENRPRYNLSLNLDTLRVQFDTVYGKSKKQLEAWQKLRLAAEEKKLGRSLTKAESRQMAITIEELDKLRAQARLQVIQEVVGQISQRMGEAIPFDPVKFERAYATRLALPYPVLTSLSPDQIARFEENFTNFTVADLDLQSEREYPFGVLAAHVLGAVRRDDSSAVGEDAFFSYRLPDYSGIAGIEGKYNDWLRGTAGAESVLVNNLGYRQSENVWQQPEAGHNVVLTIDLDIQRAAEASMLKNQGPDARGAVVVMDVRNGDVLAMVSSPALNPDYSKNKPEWMNDAKLLPQINRALQENLAPGSIFKTVVAIAALEDGLNPNEIYHVDANPERPDHGYYRLSKTHIIRDEAPPGDYNFKKAFIHSSNSYFVNYGLRVGAEKIARVGREFHLGERTGLYTGYQETRGNFPSEAEVRGWRAGSTANMSIGQGDIEVTPMQMAVMVSAIANGGYVLWPRLVQRIEPLDATRGQVTTNFPAGQIRDRLQVHPRSLNLLRDAMLADVEDKGQGTGTAAAVPGLTICGKTGTAQVQDSAGREIGRNLWFASYAPFEKPQYAVVVMVQTDGEGFGGTICAPIAHDIYAAILKKETPATPRVLADRN